MRGNSTKVAPEAGSDSSVAADESPVDTAVTLSHPFRFNNAKVYELDIPKESIYGIALLGPTILDQGSSTNFLKKIWLLFSHCYLLLIINFVCQIYLLVIIAEIVQRKAPQDIIGLFAIKNPGAEKDGTCNANDYMIFVCTCLFVACVLGDLAETFTISQWLYHIDIKNKITEISLSETESGNVKMVLGMTRLHKIFDVIFIIIPKCIIGILLAWYGAVYVAISDTNENAFLNTLAIYFICEIDELLFKAFIPSMLQTALSKVSPISANVNPKIKEYLLLYGPILMCTVVGILVFSSVSATCFCNTCGVNSTSFCSPESLNNAVAKGRKWNHYTCCNDPKNPEVPSNDPEFCPAWYDAHNMTMPAVLVNELKEHSGHSV